MFNYDTIEEIATAWGVTSRYVQQLCRDGKIEGAIKRAGAWFVPSDAPNPIKNSRADDEPFQFSGTKKKIFESAIKLFTQKGYENASINDIADTIGIRQSAVYNHFRSKQELLDTIYDYYYYNHIRSRPSPDSVERLLREGSLEDIITKGFIYDFDPGVFAQMADVAKIIAQRSSMDEKASTLFRDLLLEEGVRFVETGLDKAIAVGRIASVDTHAIAVLINCVRLYDFLWWLINPPQESYLKMLQDEQTLYKFIASLLSDINPPSINDVL